MQVVDLQVAEKFEVPETQYPGIHTYIYMYIYTHTETYLRPCIYIDRYIMCVCVCVCVCVYVYVYICIYAYICTHILSVCVCVCLSVCLCLIYTYQASIFGPAENTTQNHSCLWLDIGRYMCHRIAGGSWNAYSTVHSPVKCLPHRTADWRVEV